MIELTPYQKLMGTPVYFDSSMTDTVQVKFPRSKKKRVRRKWTKQKKNYRDIPKKEIYQLGDTLIGHPDTIHSLVAEMNKKLEAGMIATPVPIMGAPSSAHQNRASGDISAADIINAVKELNTKYPGPLPEINSLLESSFGMPKLPSVDEWYFQNLNSLERNRMLVKDS